MFDKLRSAFSNVAKSLGERELKEDDVDDVLFELEISLMDADVASEVINSIRDELKKRLAGTVVDKKIIPKFIRDSLIEFISRLFDDAGTVDLLQEIKRKQDSVDPYIVSFVGINGTGKTTTVAKVAHLLKNSKISVAIAASDTFRAGAIEQIREHANRLNLKIIAQNYGADPAAVARDAVLYARSHKVDCVLIDTAGRMQTSKNLMEQIKKITNVVKPDLTIFVGDSLAGNDTVNQARQFHENVMFDASILTKSDADARGGAALSIVKVTSSPIIFVGTGQEYGDLIPFDKEVFLKTIFGSIDGINPDAEMAHQVKVRKEADNEYLRDSAKLQDGAPAEKDANEAQNAPLADNKKLVQEAEPTQKPEPTREPALSTTIQEPAQVAEPTHQLDTSRESASKSAHKPESSQEPERVQKPGHVKPAQDTRHEVKTKDTSKHTAMQKSKTKSTQPEQRKLETKDIFEGIDTNDIILYSDMYDIPPPENDAQAANLAKRIRKWLSDGKPDPGQASNAEMRKLSENNTHKLDDKARNTKPKQKKKGLFGRFRR